jgi:hypothetical protein
MTSHATHASSLAGGCEKRKVVSVKVLTSAMSGYQSLCFLSSVWKRHYLRFMVINRDLKRLIRMIIPPITTMQLPITGTGRYELTLDTPAGSNSEVKNDDS